MPKTEANIAPDTRVCKIIILCDRGLVAAGSQKLSVVSVPIAVVIQDCIGPG